MDRAFKKPRCIITEDELGTHYTVPADKTKDHTQPSVDIWWNRLPQVKQPRGSSRLSELLFIRQENDFKDHADLVQLTLGQVYDAIDAFNRAVERP